MKYSKDYFTGMKHLADAINYELDQTDKYIHDKSRLYDDSDYYHGIATGLKEAKAVVENAFYMQLEVKGDEQNEM